MSAKRSLIIGVAGASLLCAGAAFAQDNAIGPPALRDFQLQPRERTTAPPPQQGPQDPQNPQPQNRQPPPQRPVQVAPPPPTTGAPTTTQPAPTTAQPQRTPPAGARPAPGPAAPAGPATGQPQAQPAPTGTVPVQLPPTTGAPAPVDESVPATPTAAPPPAPADGGIAPWLYAVPVGLLALLGIVLWRRRRARAEAIAEAAAIEEEAAAAPVPAKPAAPRPDPTPRPWLELDLKTVRASFNPTEAVIEFELRIANDGGSAARDLKIDVKMFNAGAEQDQQIGSFFRTAGRDQTRLHIPGINAGQDGVIRGEVAMPLEEMKAVKLDGRMLFIPVVAVNILYEWGEGRSGQSAKSYVVGRELEEQSEKMGAFRVDQGPRIWRTVGQRQHKLARRV